MADRVAHDPVVHITDVRELDRDLVVVPDGRVQLVPNIGVIGGRDAVLVVETGLGPRNAEKVLEFASEYARGAGCTSRRRTSTLNTPSGPRCSRARGRSS